MKYVILDRMGIEVPVIFSELESHIDHVPPHQSAIAAGLCRFNVSSEGKVGVSCWGHSYTIKAKSRFKIDEAIILQHNEFSA